MMTVKKFNITCTCGLYYKRTTIVNYASSIVNKLEALLTDDARVIIYDHHVFIVQVTGTSSGDKTRTLDFLMTRSVFYHCATHSDRTRARTLCCFGLFFSSLEHAKKPADYGPQQH
jgi:hypothetical protein